MKHLAKNLKPLLFLAFTLALIVAAFSQSSNSALGDTITQQMMAMKK